MKRLFELFIICFIISGCAVSQSNQKDLKVHDDVELLYNDIKCENLVEPYDYVGNIASITALIAKVEAKTLFSKEKIDKAKIYKNGLKQLNWMPIAMEIDLGQAMHDERKDIIPNKGRNKKYYKKAKNILDKIVKNIGQETPYNFEIYLIRGNHKDIFSNPGGKIYLTKSVLRDSNFAKLSIAHEVAHSLKRHYVMEYQTIVLDLIDDFDMIDSLKASIINYDNSKDNKYKKVFKKMGAIYAVKDTLFNIVKNFNKNQELEADSCAVRLLANEDNLYKIIDSFYKNLSKMSVEVEKKKEPLHLFDFNINTHPTNKERLENIKTLLKEINAK